MQTWDTCHLVDKTLWQVPSHCLVCLATYISTQVSVWNHKVIEQVVLSTEILYLSSGEACPRPMLRSCQLLQPWPTGHLSPSLHKQWCVRDGSLLMFTFFPGVKTSRWLGRFQRSFLHYIQAMSWDLLWEKEWKHRVCILCSTTN